MEKLIAAFKSEPNDKNRAKLNAYAKRHSMAVCLLTAEEVKFLRDNGFTFV